MFSTLHTNDAPGALTRLMDMEVEPYLVASALEGVLAQRLVRVLCTACRIHDDRPATQAIKNQIGVAAGHVIWRSVGCEACRQTGYHGRRAIFEMMGMNDEIRSMIMSSRSAGEIRMAAVRDGMRSLAEDGWRIVAEGQTTVDEVLRVTRADKVVVQAAMNGAKE